MRTARADRPRQEKSGRTHDVQVPAARGRLHHGSICRSGAGLRGRWPGPGGGVRCRDQRDHVQRGRSGAQPHPRVPRAPQPGRHGRGRLGMAHHRCVHAHQPRRPASRGHLASPPAGTSSSSGDAAAFAARFPGVTPDAYFDPVVSGLAGGGEIVTLADSADVVIDSVTYDDVVPWPIAPDGGGPSLELIDPFSDNGVGPSWAASTGTDGTPQAQNSVFNAPPPSLNITATPFRPNAGRGRDGAGVGSGCQRGHADLQGHVRQRRPRRDDRWRRRHLQRRDPRPGGRQPDPLQGQRHRRRRHPDPSGGR